MIELQPCPICYSTICGCSAANKAKARTKENAKKRYVCGDGTRHATELQAIQHANRYHARTGKVISVTRR